jgi:hypothetical protein
VLRADVPACHGAVGLLGVGAAAGIGYLRSRESDVHAPAGLVEALSSRNATPILYGRVGPDRDQCHPTGESAALANALRPGDQDVEHSSCRAGDQGRALVSDLVYKITYAINNPHARVNSRSW